nr:uncharacterized protein LOC128701436 [Cherax quadricarinatus]
MALQAGDNIRPKVPRPPSETRKIRKPLMERKRRERINTSLNDLATLLTEARLVKSEAGRPTKLEKADILELTVKHMLSLKGRAGGAWQGTDPTSPTSKSHEEALKGSSAEGVIPQGRPAVQEYDVPQGGTSPLGSVPQGNNSTQRGPVSGEDTIPQGAKVQQGDGTAQDDANAQGIVAQRSTSSPVTNAMTLQASEDKVSAVVAQGTAPTMCPTGKDENYRLGFKRCMSAIDSAMKQYLENQQDNIRPRLLQHLHNFLMMMEGKNSTSSGDTEYASTSTSKISTQGQPPAHATAPSKTVTSSFKGEASSSPVTGITLVPTRLPGGGLAFVIQGPLDPSVLLRTAEDIKNLDSQNVSKIGIRNVKAEVQHPPAATTAGTVVSNTVQVSSATATPAKLEPGKVKTEKSKCENMNDISKPSCTENPLMEEQTFTTAPGKLTANSEVNCSESSISASSPVTSVTPLIPSVKVTSFNKPAEKSASKQNLHRLPPTPPTPPTRGNTLYINAISTQTTTASDRGQTFLPCPTLPDKQFT